MKRLCALQIVVYCLALGAIGLASFAGCGGGGDEPTGAPTTEEIDMGDDPAAYEEGEKAIQ
jgi:hypothetical protein